MIYALLILQLDGMPYFREAPPCITRFATGFKDRVNNKHLLLRRENFSPSSFSVAPVVGYAHENLVVFVDDFAYDPAHVSL